MPEWFCRRCHRWVNGARCKLCRAVMDSGSLGFTHAEGKSIAKGEQDG